MWTGEGGGHDGCSTSGRRLRYPAPSLIQETPHARFRRRRRPPHHRRGRGRGAARRRHCRRCAIAAGLACMVAEPALAGLLGGGFLMVREPGGQSAGSRLLRRDAEAQPPGRRARLPRHRGEFGTATQEFHIGAGCDRDARRRRRAGRGACPLRSHADARARPARRSSPRARASPSPTTSPSSAASSRPILTATPAARALFCRGDALMPEGFLFRNPEFADVHRGDGARGAAPGHRGRGRAGASGALRRGRAI